MKKLLFLSCLIAYFAVAGISVDKLQCQDLNDQLILQFTFRGAIDRPPINRVMLVDLSLNTYEELPISGGDFDLGSNGLIAFSNGSLVDAQTGSQIFYSDIHGTSITRLQNQTSTSFSPSWSPDGSRLAFVSNDITNLDIYISSLTNGNLVNLTSHPSRDEYPTWSPDGQEIAFTSNRDGFTESYVINLADNALRRLTFSTEENYYNFMRWSPQGDYIAVRGGREDIFILDLATSQFTNLTPDIGDTGRVSWVNDDHVMYLSVEFGLVIRKIDGTNTQIVPLPETWDVSEFTHLPYLNVANLFEPPPSHRHPPPHLHQL